MDQSLKLDKFEYNAVHAYINDSIVKEGFGTIVAVNETGLSTFTSVGFTEKALPELVISMIADTRLLNTVYLEFVSNWEQICSNVNNTFELTDGCAKALNSKYCKTIELDTTLLGEMSEYHDKRYSEVYRLREVIFSDSEGRFYSDENYCGKYTQCIFPEKTLH